MYDINFEYYKIFYYVAKYRNITKAAAALGSNQPNVSRIMKLLESQLNCRLFVREARGITLTQEGEILYSHVEIAYKQLLNAQEEMFRQGSLKGGTVEVGATETAIHLFLLKAICDFKHEYSDIKIKIHNNTTPEIIKNLLSGRLDFAVITTPFNAPSNVLCDNILDFNEILVGGERYKALSTASISQSDFRNLSWIGLGRGSATYNLYRNFFIEHGLDMEPDMEVATSDLLIPLIENNLGVGFVAESLAAPLVKEGRLTQINLDCDVPKRSIQIVSDKGRGKSLAADTLYQYLKRGIRK